MCTLTILRDSERVLVTMNRDERRDRAPEGPPKIAVDPSTGVAWVGPRDGNAGGTWMGMNEFGVVACLLNRYGADEAADRPAAPRPSRGGIVARILGIGGWGEVVQSLAEAFDPAPYDGFRLVLASADEDPRVVDWSGDGDLATEVHPEPSFFLTSSSWRQDVVLPWRRERFDEWMAGGSRMEGRIPGIHLLRPEGMDSWAPLMSRELSATRSITQAELGRRGHGLRLRWWPVEQGGRTAKEPEGEAALALRQPLERQIAP